MEQEFQTHQRLITGDSALQSVGERDSKGWISSHDCGAESSQDYGSEFYARKPGSFFGYNLELLTDASFLDALGMEFYLTVIDQYGRSADSPHGLFIQIPIDSYSHYRPGCGWKS